MTIYMFKLFSHYTIHFGFSLLACYGHSKCIIFGEKNYETWQQFSSQFKLFYVYSLWCLYNQRFAAFTI